VYKINYQENGLPHVKQFESLFALGEWLQNLHWWGRKPTQIIVYYEKAQPPVVDSQPNLLVD